MKCCICGQGIGSYGNNPWPVKGSGECCDLCNMTVVLQARIKQMDEKKEGK